MNMYRPLCLLGIALIVASCRHSAPDIVPGPVNDQAWDLETPAGWPAPVYRFEGNPPGEMVFRLGKRLFYDPGLSRDGSISCASCHFPSHGFSDTLPLSSGVEGRSGHRNSPPLFNLAWYPYFMWDGGINHLEIQPLAPITTHEEMDMPLDSLIQRLQHHPSYPLEFRSAFGSDGISSHRLFLALAQFMGRMVSHSSKYDRYVEGSDSLSPGERRGLSVFLTHCSSCHAGPLFTDFSFRNNGLEYVESLQDSGRKRVTQDPGDMMKFRVPTLRNVAVTGPYMHRGNFTTLREVLEHYRSNLQSPATLDPELVGGLPMSDQDLDDLESFLHTLTDRAFLEDPRWQQQ